MNNEPQTTARWTTAQDQAAKAQGWLLSNDRDGRIEIQYLQDNVDGGTVVFDDDEDAQKHVRLLAQQSDPLALAALKMVGRKAW